MAAILVRAALAHGSLPRVASVSCQFLSVGRFAPVELEATTLRRARRAESVRCSMRQDGKPVAEALIWLVAAGPRVYGMRELVRGYLEARGKRRLTMPVRIPGKAGRAYRAGDNLALDGADQGTLTWEDFLGGAARAPGEAHRSPCRTLRETAPATGPRPAPPRNAQESSFSSCMRSTFPVAFRGSGSVVMCQRDGTLK